MSLINKMLQDLERRNGAATAAHPLDGGVQAVPGGTAPGSRTALWGVALVLGTSALAAAWTARAPEGGAAALAAWAPPAPTLPVAAAKVAEAPATEFVPSAMADMPAVQPLAPQPRGTLGVPTRAPTQAEADAAPAVLAPAVVKRPAPVVADAAAPDAHSTASAGLAVAPDKPGKRFTSRQQVENLYKQALAQLQQGHGNDAQQSLQQILALDADHAKARQLLASLLVEADALDAAAALLREGLRRSPGEAVFSMALARLQVELGSTDLAIETMAQGVQAAAAEPHYHAFYAALLQRAKRHDDAVQQYLVALRSDPAMPNWLVGIGIALQATGKNRDAAEAFTRARDGGLLGTALMAFVEQRLRQLQ
jgi:MSHA biogenesis protein MshN